MLYMAMREWWHERNQLQILALGLGFKSFDPDGLDDLLADAAKLRLTKTGRTTDRAQRSRDIAAFVAAAG